MTDGPFKNLKLGKGWNRFVEAVLNDAVDQSECTDLANDSLVRGLLTSANSAILENLYAYAGQDQMVFDQVSDVEDIFDRHDKTPFSDQLQKQLIYLLTGGVQMASALAEAIEASVESHIAATENRLQEEFISLRESRALSEEKYESGIAKVYTTFKAVDISEICNALRGGNKNAFKAATSKKEGLDEGPRL